MMTTAICVFGALACAWLVWRGMAEHHEAMARRHGLLEEARGLLSNASVTFAPDQFPVVTGCIDNGSWVKIELIADTMITRRLPQLWLRVTLADRIKHDGPTFGALARPTGAEYYSMVHGMPEWMAPPEAGISILMRGDGRATPMQATMVTTHFQKLFADPLIKEAVITPRATRIMMQVSQGERAAHMFLRQASFSLATVPGESIRRAILLATSLSMVLAEPERVRIPESA
jgi:hypothetical protein